MAFYFVEWIVLILLITPSESPKMYTKIRNVVGGIIYVFFAVFRNIQIDHALDGYTYYTIFHKADISFPSYLAISNVEPGYSLLAWILKHLTDSYLVMLLVVHVFIYCAYIYFIKNIPWTKFKILPVAVLCLDLFSAYYIQRNVMAVSFGLIMLILLYRKKHGTAALSLFLGIMVHYSAIILIPVYCFIWLLDRNKYLNKTKIIFLEILSIAFMMIVAQFLSIYMKNSQKYFVYQNTGSIAAATVIVVIIILSLYMRKLYVLNDKYPVTRVLGLSMFSVLLIIPLQMQYSIMYRMNIFFLPVICVMMMYLAEVYYRQYWKYLFYIVAIVYYVYRMYVFFVVEVLYAGVPYKFFIGW